MKDFKGIIAGNVFLGRNFLNFPGKGSELRKRLRMIFRERMILYKTRFDPDFILFTENLFGTNMFSLNDVRFIENLFKELEIPIIVKPGLLDEYNEVSIYNKIDFSENVTLLKKNDDVFKDYENRFIIMESSEFAQENTFNIILSKESGNIRKNCILINTNERHFSYDKDTIEVPCFEFLCDFDQEEAGCVMFSYIGGKSSAVFLNETEFRIYNVKINMNDMSSKEELEEFINGFSGKDNIVRFLFYGSVSDVSTLRYIDDIERFTENSFLFSEFVDRTTVSEELIKMIPPHIEEGLYIKNVRKSFFQKEDKKDIEQKIIKKGILFFDLNI